MSKDGEMKEQTPWMVKWGTKVLIVLGALSLLSGSGALITGFSKSVPILDSLPVVIQLILSIALIYCSYELHRGVEIIRKCLEFVLYAYWILVLIHSFNTIEPFGYKVALINVAIYSAMFIPLAVALRTRAMRKYFS